MPYCFKTAVGPAAPFALDGSVVTNADGTTTFKPRTDVANCEFVVLTGADYGSWQQLVNMSPDEAGVIGMQVGLVWAVAYGFKLIRKALSVSSNSDEQ
jgi:hypothetical protein